MDNTYECDLDLDDPGQAHEITINFPIYAGVCKLYIGLKKGCVLKAAADYHIEKPIVYCGSSVTQGSCASRPGNAYPTIISRRLDCNFVNLGFSGRAWGEPEIAQYISGLEMSAFVFDYDHNADTPKELLDTHEPMFQAIRKANPSLPILLLSRVYNRRDKEIEERRDIIRQTYQNAYNAGDRHVYFIDGGDLFAEENRNDAMTDPAHPNDCGYVMMANVIGNTLKKMLSLP